MDFELDVQERQQALAQELTWQSSESLVSPHRRVGIGPLTTPRKRLPAAVPQGLLRLSQTLRPSGHLLVPHRLFVPPPRGHSRTQFSTSTPTPLTSDASVHAAGARGAAAWC